MEMTARDRKLVFVLIGVAVVALLLFVFVLHKGGSNPAPTNSSVGTTAPQSPQPPAPPKKTTHHSTSGKTSSPHHSSTTPTGAVRDPFAPLVAASPGATPSP